MLVSYRNISMADIIRVPYYNGENLDKVLYDMGADTSKQYETTICTHRTLSNQIVTCEYFICLERLDKEWIRSGHASIEALYASKPEYASELIKMSRQGIGERQFRKNGSDKNYSEE